MNLFALLILVFITCFNAYGQVKVNPGGKFFNYNETKIYFEDTGQGEPLLLLHNFFNTADCWKPFVESYAKQFRTITVDLTGHGRSDIFPNDDSSFKHADNAKIILALLDSLKLYKVNAIGASSGGMVLLYLNIMQPDRFKSVVTIGAQTYFSKHARDLVLKIGVNQFMEWAKPHGPEKQMILARQFSQMHKLYGDPSFTPGMLNTIRAKWLVIQGDNDDIVPLQQAIEMHLNIPNSRLWIIPNGGHLPHLEARYQSEFVKVSLEFLKGMWDADD